jgi:hypothetical protein
MQASYYELAREGEQGRLTVARRRKPPGEEMTYGSMPPRMSIL